MRVQYSQSLKNFPSPLRATLSIHTHMTSKLSKPLKGLFVVSLGFSVIAIGSKVLACSIMGGCTFGKYRAEATLLDTETQRPLANRELHTRIHDGAILFASLDKAEKVVTNDLGQASFEFKRSFSSPLSIRMHYEETRTRALFGFSPEEIKANTTLTETQPETFITGGGQKGSLTLVVEVGNWSLF